MSTICILSEEAVASFKKDLPKSWLPRNALAIFCMPFALLYSFCAFSEWYLSSGAADEEPQ